MQNSVFRKSLVIGIIILFVGASIVPSTSGNLAEKITAINEKNNGGGRSRDILFFDDFNDNIKDYGKWTEVHNDGTWMEMNQRTEFYLGSSSSGMFEGIESIYIPVTINLDTSVIISVDIISYISGICPSGQTRFQVSDGTNSVSINYYRPLNQLLYKDSNDADWTVLGYRDDGSWGNQIKIFSDRYKVQMDTNDSGWIYDSLFSSSSQIKVAPHIKKQDPGNWQAGYDNVTVQYQNQPPYPPSNPDPEDGETNIDTNTYLSWTGGDPNPEDTVVYNVYFEADNPDPDILVSDHQSETSFDPGTMDYGTVYYWKISAIDNHNRVTQGPVWSFTTEEGDNQPPGIPTITGETNGNAGTEYEYTFNAVDPDSDNVKYHIDWDDGDSEETGFNPSGTDVKVKHIFVNQDTYTIKVTAEDTNGLIGPEGTLTVTMPRNKAIMNIPFLQFLQNFLQQYPILYQLLQRFLQL